MATLFWFAFIGALLCTLAALTAGMFGFVKGGAFNDKYGNKLMRLRVYAQGAALVLFALCALTYKS